jgi:hypothetical protein
MTRSDSPEGGFNDQYAEARNNDALMSSAIKYKDWSLRNIDRSRKNLKMKKTSY